MRNVKGGYLPGRQRRNLDRENEFRLAAANLLRLALRQMTHVSGYKKEKRGIEVIQRNLEEGNGEV